MSVQKKPPTQVAGIQGFSAFEAKPVTMNEPVPVIDWRKLAAHPPFQMFVHERTPNAECEDSERLAFQYIERFVREVDGNTLLQKYVAWHREKGYWPEEDCFGEMLGDKAE